MSIEQEKLSLLHVLGYLEEVRPLCGHHIGELCYLHKKNHCYNLVTNYCRQQSCFVKIVMNQCASEIRNLYNQDSSIGSIRFTEQLKLHVYMYLQVVMLNNYSDLESSIVLIVQVSKV